MAQYMQINEIKTITFIREALFVNEGNMKGPLKCVRRYPKVITLMATDLNTNYQYNQI